MIDPRMTPITRNADLYLPVRPGTDVALLMGMLHVVLREGWEKRDFINQCTLGFEEVAEIGRAMDSPQDSRADRCASGVDRKGGPLVCRC